MEKKVKKIVSVQRANVSESINNWNSEKVKSYQECLMTS